MHSGWNRSKIQKDPVLKEEVPIEIVGQVLSGPVGLNMCGWLLTPLI